ncbi:MAG: FAD-dependent oxidoreductase [Gammaproteobacteria bacterium]
MRIAIVGSGISGLGAAWALSPRHEVVIFEREVQPGGHAHTVEVDTKDGVLALDTGFVVYNELNYPQLTRLFATLGIESQPSDMSFSVYRSDRGRVLEWAGGNGAAGLFAQKQRLADVRHWRLLTDIVRFNRIARATLDNGILHGTLGEFLRGNGFTRALAWHYLIPMTAAIWSCPPQLMLETPANTILRFLANHGLLNLRGRPWWRSVKGGSTRYVSRLLAASGTRVRLGTAVTRITREACGVMIESACGRERFDACVLASHADESLALIGDADSEEHNILGSFCFSANDAYLHSDESLMPASRRAWASWNVRMNGRQIPRANVSVTYWLNRLQRLATPGNYFVTLNPERPPRGAITRIGYTHPVLDTVAVEAQHKLPGIQGRGGLYYAGAWTRYGFHEDGLASGLDAARAVEDNHACDNAREATP